MIKPRGQEFLGERVRKDIPVMDLNPRLFRKQLTLPIATLT
ncbi:MAG: hypothetical protein AAF316_11755 [Cyanobacteria bacterium P01_A01_bin.80]